MQNVCKMYAKQEENNMVEKTPITEMQFQDLIQTALSHPNPDAIKTILILRYTGMHISVLSDPYKSDVCILQEQDGEYISWKRPKKQGRDSHTYIKISRHIKNAYNLSEWIEDLKFRRKKLERSIHPQGKNTRISRQYFFYLVRDVGEKSGIKNLSPLSLRHTFAVQGIKTLGSELTRQKLNCSRKTFVTYSKYTMETEKEIYKNVNW